MTVVPTRTEELALPSRLELSLTFPDKTTVTISGDIPSDADTIRAYLRSLADALHQNAIDRGWFAGGVRPS